MSISLLSAVEFTSMRIAYFDCFSGISGDMCLAALIDSGASLERVQRAVESFQLGVSLSVTAIRKHAFRGLSLQIQHPDEHVHRNLSDIHSLIGRGDLTPGARELAMRVFERIARAEAKVHGTTIDRVHFHEVGAIDSIVDIVGISVAWDELQIQHAVASPVPTGTGHTRIAHGLVSIPAPATAELLANIPIAACSLPMEMTTPTGAAVLRELVSDYGPLPPMQVGRIGYGAGTRDLEDRPNLLRILIGESVPSRSSKKQHAPHQDHRLADDANAVVVLETNLDDISGEQIGFAIEKLWAAGALDVFSIPIYMKKGRPGTLLSVIAKPEDKGAMEKVLLTHTGTLGIRFRKQSRTILPRAHVDVDTPWGVIRGKVAELPNGQIEFSPEYDACRDIAIEEGLRLVDVMEEVRECYYAEESAHDRLGGLGAEDSPRLDENQEDLSDETIVDDFSNGLASIDDDVPVTDGHEARECDDTIDIKAFGHDSQSVHSNRDERSDRNDQDSGGTVDSDMDPQNEAAGDKNFYRWDSSPWQEGN
ncbi:MAG: nickel pincer cofactor biosynthesis protein LarC [Pirellula sp.]